MGKVYKKYKKNKLPKDYCIGLTDGKNEKVK
jgi:hypothetical protein